MGENEPERVQKKVLIHRIQSSENVQNGCQLFERVFELNAKHASTTSAKLQAKHKCSNARLTAKKNRYQFSIENNIKRFA